MLEQYYSINEGTGVSINLLQGGGVSINTCSVIVKNKSLNIEKRITDLNSVEELQKHLPANAYLSINLTGKGILQKQVKKVEEINQQNFSGILPSGNFNDFYIQNFISGNQSFISVIRKTDADKWIGQLNKQGFVPLILTLGPFPVQQIIAQLNVYDDEALFHGHLIQRNTQKEWLTYQYKELAFSPFQLKVESEIIDEKLIIPYANAFQLVLASKLNLIQAEVSLLNGAFKSVIDKKKIQVQGFLVLSVFFILLLVNFLLFSWLNSSNTQLTYQVSRTTQSTNDVQAINDHVKIKEALLQDLGWDGGINKSSLTDQLAALLPGEVSWKEVAFNPIDATNSRVQKNLHFMTRKIRIVGTSQKIIPVNEWIARAKTKSWVKNIQLDSYTYNSELSTGQFTVVIDY